MLLRRKIFPVKIISPATTAEHHDEDDQDADSTGRHPHDDGHVVHVDGVEQGVGEGESHVALRHSSVVEGDTRVLTQVTGGHRGHGEAEVSFNTS